MKAGENIFSANPPKIITIDPTDSKFVDMDYEIGDEIALEGDLAMDLARVTETVELVQLAKAAGVPRAAVNTCFDNEVRHPRHRHTIQRL